MSQVLLPHQSTEQTANILVVGTEGTNKHEFSKTLVSKAKHIRIQLHTARSLPLPEEQPCVDFICFIINSHSKLSLGSVQESLKHVHISYFVGKCIILVNTKDDNADNGIPAVELHQLAGNYQAPLLFHDLQSEQGRAYAANRILSLVKTAQGMTSNLSPLLIDAVNTSLTTANNAFLFSDE